MLFGFDWDLIVIYRNLFHQTMSPSIWTEVCPSWAFHSFATMAAAWPRLPKRIVVGLSSVPPQGFQVELHTYVDKIYINVFILFYEEASFTFPTICTSLDKIYKEIKKGEEEEVLAKEQTCKITNHINITIQY